VESGEDWTLHLGDSIKQMAALPDLCVDVTITDPPYEAEAHEKGKRQGKPSGGGKEERGKKYERVVDEEFDFAPITSRQRKEVSRQIGRVTKRLALVFCQVEAAMLWSVQLNASGFITRRVIPWVKPDAMPSLHGRWPGQSFEAIVLAIKPGKTAPIGGRAVYYEHTRERGEQRQHPTAKPLALMRNIVQDFSERGDLVLDAFAGSATTGVACRALGRRFLGWELLPDYYEVACRRLRGEEARPTAEQPSLTFGVAP
jgi:site-specific DNA-methyltransferase (adenine-specific)